MEGEALPDIIFTEADPPIGGLRTWPQIRKIVSNKTDTIHKITNLKTVIKRAIKANKDNRTKGIFGRLLQEARNTDIDFSIQVYSRAPYKCKRGSYEVARGSNVYRCKRRHNVHVCSVESATNRSQTHTSWGM